MENIKLDDMLELTRDIEKLANQKKIDKAHCRGLMYKAIALACFGEFGGGSPLKNLLSVTIDYLLLLEKVSSFLDPEKQIEKAFRVGKRLMTAGKDRH